MDKDHELQDQQASWKREEGPITSSKLCRARVRRDRPIVDKLPYEVLLNVTEFLDGHEVCRLGLTCRTLKNLLLLEERPWKKRVLAHEYGKDTYEVLRQHTDYCWGAAYARLFCYDRKICYYCFEQCKELEPPTTLPSKGIKPICVWAKRAIA